MFTPIKLLTTIVLLAVIVGSTAIAIYYSKSRHAEVTIELPDARVK